MNTTQMSRADALRAMARHGDSILKASFANEIAQAFGKDVWQMKLVYEIKETGLDWGARSETWDTGEAVNCSTLASVLCEELEVPLVKYATDYIGAGKRSRAIVARALISMDLHFNVREHRCCDLCRTYDLDGGKLCFGCARMLRQPYEANVHEVGDFGGWTKPWWVKRLDHGNYESFATRAEARRFAALMRRAQAELRHVHA